MEARKHAGVHGIKKSWSVTPARFLLGALSLGLSGFDQLFRAKMRSPRKDWIAMTVNERASVRMLDNKCVEACSAIAAISSRSSWNLHIEEALRYKLFSVLNVGEFGHCSFSFLVWFLWLYGSMDALSRQALFCAWHNEKGED